MHASHPTDEAERLAALRELEVLDSEPERDFDDVVVPELARPALTVASWMLQASIASIGVVAMNSNPTVGWRGPETPPPRWCIVPSRSGISKQL